MVQMELSKTYAQSLCIDEGVPHLKLVWRQKVKGSHLTELKNPELLDLGNMQKSDGAYFILIWYG